MSISNLVGKNIRFIRRLRNMSQDDLAYEAHSERAYISNIERGKANPTIDVLDRISKALSIEPYILLLPYNEKHFMRILCK
jgi:transcriptional regulator with XRE-family HTH domain